MASQGPNFPNAAISIAGGFDDWTNPSNVLASDSAVASTPGTTSQSDILAATSFGFTLPSDVTVSGFEITASVFVLTAGNTIDVAVTKDGANGNGNSHNSTAAGVTTLGGSTDLWGWTGGTTPTPAEVNASAFGILMDSINDFGGTTSIDYVTMTVYYTLPPSGVTSVDWSRFPKQQLARTS